jgi:hypothetical protein
LEPPVVGSSTVGVGSALAVVPRDQERGRGEADDREPTSQHHSLTPSSVCIHLIVLSPRNRQGIAVR